MFYWNVEDYGEVDVDIVITKNGERFNEDDTAKILAIVEHYYKRSLEDEIVSELAKSGHLK